MIQPKHEIIHSAWLTAAHELIRFDEVEKALELLNLMPAYHRDYPIPEIEALKSQILSALITPHAYLTSGLDAKVEEKQAIANVQNLLRGQVLIKELIAHPGIHLVDMGPGEYWVPIGLKALGHEFTYNPIAFDMNAKATAEKLIQEVYEPTPPSDRKIAFICHEVIEHLPSTQDIAIEALRHCGRWPDFVHLSTPLYTFDYRSRNWNKKCGLPHLRAYTPREFIAEANRLFPGYNWEYCTDAIQSLRGYKVDGPLLEK